MMERWEDKRCDGEVGRQNDAVPGQLQVLISEIEQSLLPNEEGSTLREVVDESNGR